MKSGVFTNFIPHGVHEINPNPYNLIQSITKTNTKKKAENIVIYNVMVNTS